MTATTVPAGAATPAPDEAERERIRTDLGSTLFVEAGAGAGKTSSLVARIVNLVRSGVPITGIAAITFTEKAAAELRSRTRQRLEADPGPETDAALARLDHAPIGTLHSFARRILFDFPIEAGLPPGFTVLDELESGLAFEEQWNDLLDTLLDDAEPAGGLIAGGRAFVELCEFDGFGVDKGARRMAEDFRANWDLVHDRVDLSDPGPLDLDVAAIAALADRIGSTPIPHDDTQVATVAELVALASGLSSQSLRTRLEAVWALDDKYGHWGTERKSFPGAKGKWTSAFGPSGADALEALRADEIETRPDRPRRPSRASNDTAGCCSARSSGGSSSTGLPNAPRRDSSSSTTCSCSHDDWSPITTTSVGCSTNATNGCCSTSSRTPTRSSSRSPSASRLIPMIRRSDHRPSPPSIDRGEICSRCPAACSSSATRSSRSTGSVAPTSRSICAPPTRSAPTTCGCRRTSDRRVP